MLAEDGTKEQIAQIHSYEKEIVGRTGERGEKSLNRGGDGGPGQRIYLTFEEAKVYRRITGSTGGEGGGGGNRGGDGGAGMAPIFERPLVWSVHGEVPELRTAAFCEQYRLSALICKLLVDGGFETVEGLVNATTTGVAEVGLKARDVTELMKALNKFVVEQVK
ncbi:hypothetical protein B0H19DRAFT_1057200 [Mycena capillaripes]|nr:hypothetical protein B0H19DRAFT_1057200 [Mycena capillaripes]